jgi:indolepyruvate ferredoxin oxidoreductase alpha subunit
MSKFLEYANAPAGSRFLMEGNTAFALGVLHAGYHAADGYPGTPSTEVIDRCLQYVQDKMVVGWSVSEAVAVGVAVGHAIAGSDVVVTMKIPGVFQAADAITTSAFFNGEAGAFVIYAAADYVPSSTQHVIDARYFFASSRIPVLEPRTMQEMYEIPAVAAEISKKFNTPVVILANGILGHTEGIVTVGEPKKNEALPAPKSLAPWMLTPVEARLNYNNATQKRIPELREWLNTSNLFSVEKGKDDWSVIVTGKNQMLLKDVMVLTGTNPSVFSLAATYPFPEKELVKFASEVKGKLFIIEDGDTFLEEKIRLLGFNKIIGKEKDTVLTNWDTGTIIDFLSKHLPIEVSKESEPLGLSPVARPPAICSGCPYRAFTLAVHQLKKKRKIYASFGDIGCSSLMNTTKTIDTILCMGAADSVRQGFALSRPELAHKMISVIGDSSECHSGLDSTRNAIFRNVPGVKIILDNRLTAMTGGQPAPSTPTNLAGMPHKFDLRRAIEAEGGRTVVVDSYKIEDIENSLIEALDMAEHGTYTTMILEGACVKNLNGKLKVRSIEFDHEACTNCGRCEICPGIGRDDNKKLYFTELCTDCGDNLQVCMQRCPHNAIVPRDSTVAEGVEFPKLSLINELKEQKSEVTDLPESIRMAVRGVGGQGNLFFGRVLTEVVMQTPFSKTNILKSDTHGMAQLGGSVISTFSCGNVHTAELVRGSADVLVSMEMNEVLHSGYLDLLKPGGYVLLNKYKVFSTRQMARKYPDYDKIKAEMPNYNLIEVDANDIVLEMGDKKALSANVVVLGALSKLKPFDVFPEQLWINALSSLSKNENIKTLNLNAFFKGRALIN